MLLAGCQQHQSISDAATNAFIFSARPENISQQGAGKPFMVWGFAESKGGVPRDAGRSFMERSARVDAQQMLTLAIGVALRKGERVVNARGGSMISMVVRDTMSTSTNCLVQASGLVNPIIPDSMRKLKSVAGIASLAQSKFTCELLNSARKVLDEAKTVENSQVDGVLVLRKMELVDGKEPPECRYELDVYAKVE